MVRVGMRIIPLLLPRVKFLQLANFTMCRVHVTLPVLSAGLPASLPGYRDASTSSKRACCPLARNASTMNSTNTRTLAGASLRLV